MTHEVTVYDIFLCRYTLKIYTLVLLSETLNAIRKHCRGGFVAGGGGFDEHTAVDTARIKGAITSKIKHAVKHTIKLKTIKLLQPIKCNKSPARLVQLLHNCCSPH